MTHAEYTVLHLSLISGIGPATIGGLVGQLGQHLSDLYTYKVSDLIALGVSERLSHKITQGLASVDLLNAELYLIEKHAIKVVTLISPAYPTLLKEIYMPPAVIYVKGIVQESAPMIAVVGSRKATAYGVAVVDLLVPSLAQAGWSLVSGGALGIDAAAHCAALKNKMPTIAVLGSGLLRPYPYAHKKLFEDIVAQGGAIISSFALQTDPQPGNFPARNRIIAGLSQGCLVVQAGKQSGALITAKFALEQGREVFAVPGLITEPLSAGCHQLIAQGARLVGSASDILESFGQQAVIKEVVSQDSVIPIGSLLSVEAKIIAACAQPVALDELSEQLGMSLIELQTILFDLQLEGHIVQQLTGLWQAQKVLS